MGNYNMGKAGGILASPALSMTLSAFSAISLYNVFELVVLIHTTFRGRKGLYYWSFTVATLAIIPYNLGLLFKFFEITPQSINMVIVTMIILGWIFMVTGQSVILYSRLHLIVRDPRITKYVFYMITANFFLSDVPITVLVYGQNSNNPKPFTYLYGVWERLQICLYFTQETIISCIYVVEMARMLKHTSDGPRSESSRRIMGQLIYVNILIIFIDITLLVMEFIGHYELQVIYKGAVYSIKLKLECKILNQLKSIAKRGQNSSLSGSNTWLNTVDIPTIQNQSSDPAPNENSSSQAQSAGPLPDPEKGLSTFAIDKADLVLPSSLFLSNKGTASTEIELIND